MSESNGLAITLVAERFEPGEELLVEARWELETAPEAIEVRLTWYTSGRGTGDFGVERAERIEMPGPRGQRQLRFMLPEGPYSFRGKFVAIAWAAEIVALPGEASARCDFTLAPGGREVVVEEIAPEGLAARLATPVTTPSACGDHRIVGARIERRVDSRFGVPANSNWPGPAPASDIK